MRVKIHAAAERDLPEVRALLHETFIGDREPEPVAPFYLSREICDPDFRPEQYRFRRMRGRVASALKVFVRRLHHPDGPVPVSIIGGVCTREALRGRGLIGPVIQDSLEYSRSLGVKAELIVSPRLNYYLRHGFTYTAAYERAAPVPELALSGARVEPLRVEDAGWVTDFLNAAARGYGPIVRSEEYTRKWILQMCLAPAGVLGLKLLRRGRPRAYGVFDFRKRPMWLPEIVSRSGKGSDEAALLSFCSTLGARRFSCRFPARHPLIAHLRESGVRLRATPVKRYMYYALDPSFPIPDETFEYSQLDSV